MKFIFFNLLFTTFLLCNDNVIANCVDTKVEVVNINDGTTKGFIQDKMKIKLLVRNDKVFLVSNGGESELIYIGNNQFLEKVASGHHILYTYNEKIKMLTQQKSYDFLGKHLMVNAYLKCD